MDPLIFRRWTRRAEEPAPQTVSLLGKGLGLSAMTARALAMRGIETVAEGTSFLHGRLDSLPDPFLLPDMDRATARLSTAILKGEKIVVHGDYDVDGITGTALLVDTLKLFGAHVEFHIPLRLKDGYGLSGEAVRQAAAGGAKLLLSVDCGISAVEEARLAAEIGLDLIITDHHQPPEVLPRAVAVVSPSLVESTFPCRDLAGVGVAFFLMIALRRVLREQGFFAAGAEPDLRRVLDLVALGTIADMVPLCGFNRVLTRYGLELLSRGSRPGVRALKQVAAVTETTCGAVAFHLAPRLNAAGRLEDASLGVKLLLESSFESALGIAALLDGFNLERRRIEEETLRQAVERLERGEGGERTIVLSDERWHPGVIGIVASRLVERYHRPVVLIAQENGRGKGSARSIPGFHLYRGLQACSGTLEGFGGHECAAGMTIQEGRVQDFAEAFEEVAREKLTEEDMLPRLAYDGELLLEEITTQTVREIGTLAPFGAGNPEPVFVAQGLRLQQVRPVGTSHLSFIARQGGYSFPCIAFGMASRREELVGELDLLFSPVLNAWRGEVSVRLRIRDWRPSAG